MTGIAHSAKTYSIDILVGHTTGKEFTDLPGGGNIPATPAALAAHRRHHSRCSLLPEPTLVPLLSPGLHSLPVVGYSQGPHTAVGEVRGSVGCGQVYGRHHEHQMGTVQAMGGPPDLQKTVT